MRVVYYIRDFSGVAGGVCCVFSLLGVPCTPVSVLWAAVVGVVGAAVMR